MSPADEHDGFNRRRVLQGLSAGAVGAWISPLIAGSSILPNTPADLILHNGRLHTVDREKPQAIAVAIKEGRFIASAVMPRPWPCAALPLRSSTCNDAR